MLCPLPVTIPSCLGVPCCHHRAGHHQCAPCPLLQPGVQLVAATHRGQPPLGCGGHGDDSTQWCTAHRRHRRLAPVNLTFTPCGAALRSLLLPLLVAPSSPCSSLALALPHPHATALAVTVVVLKLEQCKRHRNLHLHCWPPPLRQITGSKPARFLVTVLESFALHPTPSFVCCRLRR